MSDHNALTLSNPFRSDSSSTNAGPRTGCSRKTDDCPYLSPNSGQIICYLSSPFLDSGNNSFFNIFNDPLYHQPTTKYQIVLSGYYFIPRSCHYVSADIVAIYQTHFTVKLHAGCSYKFVGIAFYVLGVDPNNIFWISFHRIYPQYINNLPNNATELVEMPAPT